MRHRIVLVLITIAVVLPVFVIGMWGIFQVSTAPIQGTRPESGKLYGFDSGTETRPLVPSGSIVGNHRLVNVEVRSYKFDPSPIVVREGERVQLDVTSKDIAHDIEIQKLGIHLNLEPMKTQTVVFTAEKSGKYVMACSINCGLGTERLEGLLIILPKE